MEEDQRLSHRIHLQWQQSCRLFLFLTLFEGLFALLALLRQRSEAGTLLGYSPARLAVALALVAALGVLGLLLARTFRPNGLERAAARLDGFLRRPGHLFWIFAGLLFSAGLSLLAYLFTYLVLPPHLRGAIAWAGLAALQALALLAWSYRAVIRQPNFWLPVRDLPRWSNLDSQQRRTFWLLALVGLIYFAAFGVPNALGAHSFEEVLKTSGDEYVTYPYVIWMLSPAQTTQEAVYHWFIYEDYHYGYPFYLLTALALLPVRLVLGGANFGDHTQINLLVMRQMINVLPNILSALLLTYLQTRYRKRWWSLGLFVFLLFIPQVISYNIQFWHPDALVVLCAVLTLFFLEKDASLAGPEQRLGLNFALAAVTCGLAAGIKLYGFFFFLAVGGYLITELIRRGDSRGADFQRVLGRGLLFVGVMSVTMLLANPWAALPQARQRFVEIVQQKNQEMTYGYGETTAEAQAFYTRGIGASVNFLEGRYGSRWFLLFLLVSLATGSLWGPRRLTNRLILAWWLPMAIYFFYFMSYKSYHYWMPAMLPFFSGALGLAQAAEGLGSGPGWVRNIQRAAPWVVAAVLLVQFALNLAITAPDWGQWALWGRI